MTIAGLDWGVNCNCSSSPEIPFAGVETLTHPAYLQILTLQRLLPIQLWALLLEAKCQLLCCRKIKFACRFCWDPTTLRRKKGKKKSEGNDFQSPLERDRFTAYLEWKWLLFHSNSGVSEANLNLPLWWLWNYSDMAWEWQVESGWFDSAVQPVWNAKGHPKSQTQHLRCEF